MQPININKNKTDISFIHLQDIIDKTTFLHVNDFAYSTDLNAFVIRVSESRQDKDGMDGVITFKNMDEYLTILEGLTDALTYKEITQLDIETLSEKVRVITGKFLKENVIDPILLETNDNLMEHKGDLENPHNVTKVQLGLSNVENKSSQDIRDDITVSDIPDMPQSKVGQLSNFNWDTIPTQEGWFHVDDGSNLTGVQPISKLFVGNTYPNFNGKVVINKVGDNFEMTALDKSGRVFNRVYKDSWGTWTLVPEQMHFIANNSLVTGDNLQNNTDFENYLKSTKSTDRILTIYDVEVGQNVPLYYKKDSGSKLSHYGFYIIDSLNSTTGINVVVKTFGGMVITDKPQFIRAGTVIQHNNKLYINNVTFSSLDTATFQTHLNAGRIEELVNNVYLTNNYYTKTESNIRYNTLEDALDWNN